MPSTSYKTVGELVASAENDPLDAPQTTDTDSLRAARRHRRESAISEITSLLGSNDAAHQTADEESKKRVSGVWGALHGRTAWQQIRTPWFVLSTLFTVVQMTRINYFVATIRP
ncbi:hypothetical protein LTR16_012534, partial [Cryomyces antarcticus]